MELANATQYVPPSLIWMWLFPVTYLIHIAEEYWGGEGYMAYLYRLRGVRLSTARFFFFQFLGVALVIIGIFLSRYLKWPRFMLAVMGAVVLANGITHTVTAIRDQGYRPGLVLCPDLDSSGTRNLNPAVWRNAFSTPGGLELYRLRC